MRNLLVICLALSAAAPAAAAPGDAAAVLGAARNLRCVFSSALETKWEAERYNTRPQKGFSYIIGGINPQGGAAKAVGTQGASHLEMIALPNVRHFLGFTAGGDLNVTSVHAQFGRNDQELLASHSVHMAAEPPITYQHYGHCVPV
ncbi:MAG: hypothetical protein QF582_21325, partial [Alphaproteobacteria bacterium]|nr:hypothetical protein [Alphaproteobacteria bacterium]